MADQPAPLFGLPPKEVPLPRAPLVNVLWQVRFPSQGALTIREGQFMPEAMTAFQEAIKSTYPIVEKQFGHSVEVTDGKVDIQAQQNSWQFADIKREWSVTIARNFVTLQTKKYSSRSDFVSRTRKILDAVNTVFAPGAATRIGVRYVNQVAMDDLDICKMVRPAALGLYADEGLQASIVHTASETLLNAEEGNLLLRSIVLPKDSTHEPSLLPPIAKPSWVLDLDLFTVADRAFDTAELETSISASCARIYAVFSWLAKDDLREHFGGKVK